MNTYRPIRANRGPGVISLTNRAKEKSCDFRNGIDITGLFQSPTSTQTQIYVAVTQMILFATLSGPT